MKLIDAIGLGLIIVGIVMTAVNFFASRGPNSDVISSTIEEIAPAPPPVRRQYGRPIALLSTAPPHHQQQQQEVYSPYRMKNWAQCKDGTQAYSWSGQFPVEPPPEPPCVKHGGLRAFGPGKRLNER